MTTLDSSSGVESSSMGDNNSINSTTKTPQTHSDDSLPNNNHNRDRRRPDEDDDEIEEGGGGGGGDMVELWETFSKNFQQVQSVLDQNRVLIQRVNENHQSKLPDNLTKNVALIRQINGNISTVASLYSNLSADFTNVFDHQHHHHHHREDKDHHQSRSIIDK